MRKTVSLVCKTNHVNVQVEVDGPVKYEQNPLKADRRFIMLIRADDSNIRQYSFIEIKDDGSFVSYSIIDEISGMTLYANPSNFSDSFKNFLSECISVALDLNSQPEVDHGK